MLHGLYQVVGYVLKPVRDRVVSFTGIVRSSFSHRLFRIFVTFMLVNLAWVFFRADSPASALSVIGKSLEFTPWVLFDGSLFTLGLNYRNFVLVLLGLILVAAVNVSEYRGVDIPGRILTQGWWFRWLVGIGGVLFVLICGIWGPGYDAASFIYQQF